MKSRLILALLAGWLMAGAVPVHGKYRLEKPPLWACLLIRQEAQRFESRTAAIRAAQERGYTAEDIARAKLCF